MSARILFTVLGGYLGSGKTTVLNQLLRESGGRRLGVIVNDFGSINIDASLVEAAGSDMTTLANGCICCSISAGFAEAMMAMARHDPPPEHVIIETSGIADPVKVGQYGAMASYRLDGVIVVADAETIRARCADRYVGDTVLRQLRGADLIVLNKLDLINAEDHAALLDWLHAQVPQARLFPTSHGRVPLDMLLGVHGDSLPSAPPAQQHHHDAGAYATWSMTSDTALREADFREAVAAWPACVLRAKGIIHLVDAPLTRHVFQLVGRRWSLAADRPWGDDPRRSDIVVIGLSGQLEGATLLANLRRLAC